jgi:predicted nucleic acid-binding protein
MTPRQYVLDSNALIGWFEEREGSVRKVDRLLEEALRLERPLLMSAVNWGEVFYIAWRRHGESRAWETEAKLKEIPLAVISADHDRATRAAALKQKHNLGYADSFAAELSIERGAWLVTADPEFGRLGKILSLYPLPRHES